MICEGVNSVSYCCAQASGSTLPFNWQSRIVGGRSGLKMPLKVGCGTSSGSQKKWPLPSSMIAACGVPMTGDVGGDWSS